MKQEGTTPSLFGDSHEGASGNTYCQVVWNGRIADRTFLSFFEPDTYDRLVSVTYVSSPRFLFRVAEGFGHVTLVLGIPDGNVAKQFDFLNPNASLTFWNDLTDDQRRHVCDGSIEVRYAPKGHAIHSKIYLMSGPRGRRAMVGSANLILHDIDQPNLWHGNTLTGAATYDELWQGAPRLFDVVLTNPPFGGKENKDAQTLFAYHTSATQVLFLQHIINNLKPGGRCGMVVDEGIMFRTNEQAFVQTKRKLLDDCDLWCIVKLPAGTFVAAGAGVKTNLLFFTKGKPTEKTWYYDLSDVKVGKKLPLTLATFEEFFRLLPERADGDHSWTVTRAEIEAKGYDIKAVNPHAKVDVDTRTPAELLDLIEQKGKEVDEAIKKLRETIGR